MSDLHNFNAGRKSWKMYAKELTSKDGDDLTITPYDGEDLILEVSGNGNILFKEDGITYNLADLSNAASSSSNVNLTNYDDASFGNVDISGTLTFNGGDFGFNYVAEVIPNYINSFNYLANTSLLDPSNNNIFTTNNTNLDITYSPTLNIFVNLRRDSLLYSYDGISWYFCKKSDNSNFSFSGKYGGTIEWFGGNVNKFYVSLTHAGFTSTDSIYYSSNGINWTNVTVNGGAYQFMPHKLAYSPTLNKIVATGSGNGLEGLWVGDATGSSLDFTNIATNNDLISPWTGEGMFPVIWDSNLEKFILTTEQLGGGKQIYYNSDNNLTSWTLLTNIYDFNNNLTTDGTLNKYCYSMAFSPTINRSVFVGGDAIYYSDFVGGTAISNLVFKQTKDINGSNYSGSPTYRKIIWDSVSEYFIVAANAGSHDVIYSANGINWFSNNQETSSPSGYLARGQGALAYGDGKLILIGYHNNNVYQTDSNYTPPPPIAAIYNFGDNNLDASFKNLDINGNIDISHGIINFFATDEQLLGPDTGIAQKVQDLSNNLLISNNDASFNNASFNNVEISGSIIITVNDVDSQNITLLELKTNSNTPRIKHDFWQNSSGYADYQIYPSSASTTDFKIGGYNTTFETIRLNALNGIEVYSNQSTNTYGNIKCGDALFNNVEINGTIKLPDSSNNGYGVSGEILTSRGSSNTPHWVTPSAGGGTYTAGSNMSLTGTEFNIPQDIATTASPTFTNLTATGTIFANTIDRYANGQVQIFGNVNTAFLKIEHAGHVYGIATAASWYGGHNGANLFAGGASFRARSGQCQASHNLTITSDDRFKSRTVNLPDNCLDIINKLQPKKYLKHHGHYVPEGVEDSDLSGVDTKDEAGLISQDVEKIPELNWLITEQELGIDTKNYYKAIDYGSLYPYLIKAVQELNECVKSLEAEVKILKSK